MAICAYGEVAKAIIDALGLEGKIRRITICYDVHEVVTVEVERLVEEDQHERLVAILKAQDWNFEVMHDSMHERPHHCPICELKPCEVCFCPLQDSRCENGHRWHRCPVHFCVIPGEANHDPPDGCCCPTPTERDLPSNADREA